MQPYCSGGCIDSTYNETTNCWREIYSWQESKALQVHLLDVLLLVGHSFLIIDGMSMSTHKVADGLEHILQSWNVTYKEQDCKQAGRSIVWTLMWVIIHATKIQFLSSQDGEKNCCVRK